METTFLVSGLIGYIFYRSQHFVEIPAPAGTSRLSADIGRAKSALKEVTTAFRSAVQRVSGGGEGAATIDDPTGGL